MPDQQHELKSIIVSYLQGQAIGAVKARLESERDRLKSGCKDLYKGVFIELDDPYIHTILDSMNIKRPSDTYNKLMRRSNNLHQLLTHLYHDGHHHVGYLLQVIENTNPPHNWSLIFLWGTVVTAALGTFFQLNQALFNSIIDWGQRTFPTVVDWLGRTFSLLRNIPLLGLLYNGAGLAWNWYVTFSNGTTSTSHKLSRLFFKTLTASLTMAAYLISYLAGGAMVMPAAVLFVLSASIDVFKSLFIFIKNQRAVEPPAQGATWEVLAEYERSQNVYERSMQAVWVRLSAAILTTIAVGIWNFFPPSLLITITCVSIMTLVSLAKHSILTSIYEHYAHQLQATILDLDKASSEQSLHYQHTHLSQRQREQDLRQQQLEQRAADLDDWQGRIEVRNTGMLDALRAIAQRERTPAEVFEQLSLRPQEARSRRFSFSGNEDLPPLVHDNAQPGTPTSARNLQSALQSAASLPTGRHSRTASTLSSSGRISSARFFEHSEEQSGVLADDPASSSSQQAPPPSSAM